MIIILFGALSAGTKTYYVGQIATLSRQHFLPVGSLKFCFSLEIRCSIWPLTVSFQESSTISRLADCNVYWSTASHKSDRSPFN